MCGMNMIGINWISEGGGLAQSLSSELDLLPSYSIWVLFWYASLAAESSPRIM